ncbi:MAG: carboxypeptidase regulatory-like domain-containing protein [Chitinophagales bacterium]|nr:carboxypeptidase regulatory-like domain-containing protein [Chitinophagales bacterium]
MKRIYLLTLSLFCSFALVAQTASISGTVTMASDNITPLEGVSVQAVDANGNLVDFTTTSASGNYVLEDLPVGATYSIVCSFDGSVLLGVSTMDVVLGAMHILGIESLDSPYKILAGDANDSGSLSTLDLVLMRRVILNIDNTFPAGSWRFILESTSFPNPMNPFDATNIEVQLTDDINNLDIIGIKTGDLQQD